RRVVRVRPVLCVRHDALPSFAGEVVSPCPAKYDTSVRVRQGRTRTNACVCERSCARRTHSYANTFVRGRASPPIGRSWCHGHPRRRGHSGHKVAPAIGHTTSYTPLSLAGPRLTRRYS